jgi:aspartyl-tRNA(Asn)/glutamyl-tRNA(Gln) amidotransferase subunit B
MVIRTKEDAPDYRYFPDPDLPPVVVSQQEIDEIHNNLPELPVARKHRFINEFKLNEMDAHRLTQDKEWADFFESVLKICNTPSLVSNWILSRLMGALNRNEQNLSDSTITSDRFGEFIELIHKGKLSSQLAKDVLKFMVEDNRPVMKIIEDEGLMSVSQDTLQDSFDALLAEFPEEMERFKNGDVKLRGFFMGQMMKKTQGKADPKQLNELLNKLK